MPEAGGTKVPVPAWIAASLEVKEGRDPLGLQTTTQDRLMPLLLPGILELSRRARYFSFHAFLLAEYRERRLPADSKPLWAFIKRREWEYGLAAQRCPRCDSSPVGARRLGSRALGAGPFERGESVESPLGATGCTPGRRWQSLALSRGLARCSAASRFRLTSSTRPTGHAGWLRPSRPPWRTPPTTSGPCGRPTTCRPK